MKTQAERISPQYLALQRELHGRPDGYGGKGRRWVDTVVALAKHFDAWSILDYGCGQGSLTAALSQTRLGGRRLDEYDPAIKGKSQPPTFADLVVCTDVLEHIEPDRLDAVLNHLRALTRIALFAVVATRPAQKFLSDGRNAHLLLYDAAWWTRAITRHGFDTVGPVPKSPLKKPSREVVLVLR